MLYRQTIASIREGIMVLHSTRWLALSYFTYFLATAFFCLSGASGWREPDAGNHRHAVGRRAGGPFPGSLLIAPRVSDPAG
jgi:PPP family 3-phenylpropionic acid transporter